VLERAKGVRTQGCSEAAAAVPWNGCREKEGLSGVGVMYQRDLDPHGGMGVCGGRISDRISIGGGGEGRGEVTNHGAPFIDEMTKGAGVFGERKKRRRRAWALQIFSANISIRVLFSSLPIFYNHDLSNQFESSIVSLTFSPL